MLHRHWLPSLTHGFGPRTCGGPDQELSWAFGKRQVASPRSNAQWVRDLFSAGSGGAYSPPASARNSLVTGHSQIFLGEATLSEVLVDSASLAVLKDFARSLLRSVSSPHLPSLRPTTILTLGA